MKTFEIITYEHDKKLCPSCGKPQLVVITDWGWQCMVCRNFIQQLV